MVWSRAWTDGKSVWMVSKQECSCIRQASWQDARAMDQGAQRRPGGSPDTLMSHGVMSICMDWLPKAL